MGLKFVNYIIRDLNFPTGLILRLSKDFEKCETYSQAKITKKAS